MSALSDNILEHVITKARAIKSIRLDADRMEKAGLSKPTSSRYYVICAELVSEIAGYIKPSERHNGDTHGR